VDAIIELAEFTIDVEFNIEISLFNVMLNRMPFYSQLNV
jgi:hypothetical protein